MRRAGGHGAKQGRSGHVRHISSPFIVILYVVLVAGPSLASRNHAFKYFGFVVAISADMEPRSIELEAAHFRTIRQQKSSANWLKDNSCRPGIAGIRHLPQQIYGCFCVSTPFGKVILP
jgi:hypothetical protein